MNTEEAVYEFIKNEIIPHISRGSEMTAAILSGALRARKKQIAEKLSSSPAIQALGFLKENGSIDKEAAAEFAAGMFDGRDKVTVTVAEIVKASTGLELHSELLQDRLHFTRADIDKFLSLLG